MSSANLQPCSWKGKPPIDAAVLATPCPIKTTNGELRIGNFPCPHGVGVFALNHKRTWDWVRHINRSLRHCDTSMLFMCVSGSSLMG